MEISLAKVPSLTQEGLVCLATAVRENATRAAKAEARAAVNDFHDWVLEAAQVAPGRIHAYTKGGQLHPQEQ